MGENSDVGNGQEVLSTARQEKLDTLRRVLRIQIDGDWDDQMINTAFNNLERLLFRLDNGDAPDEGTDGSSKSSRRAGTSGRRRGRRN